VPRNDSFNFKFLILSGLASYAPTVNIWLVFLIDLTKWTIPALLITMNSSTFQDKYKQLNSEQKQAVDTTEGALMVIAGPGSGKTQILSMRIANILLNNDVNPNNILCLTFTNAAAKNMQDRLAKIIGPTAYDVNICTFHSFGSMIINKHQSKFFEQFGLDAKQAEPIVQQKVFEEIMNELPVGNTLASKNPDGAWNFLRDIKGRISDLRKGGLSPEGYSKILKVNKPIIDEFQAVLDEFQDILALPLRSNENKNKFIVGFGEMLEQFQSLIRSQNNFQLYNFFGKDLVEDFALAYQEALAGDKPKTSIIKDILKKYAELDRENNYILKDLKNFDKQLTICEVYKKYRAKMLKLRLYDFDDMILDVVAKIKSDQELKNQLLETYQYVLVDEFQDTSTVQLDLILQLTDTIATIGVDPNMMVVGDDDQSIYKFQGASTANLIKFTELYRGCRFITLQHNYRSSHKIVENTKKLANNITDRISRLLPDIDKNPMAHNLRDHSQIHHLRFDSVLEECLWVVEKCKELVANGTEPNKIAILSRGHKDLSKIIEISSKLGLPTNYEKGNNILLEPKVVQLISMMEYVDSLNNPASKDEKEQLLCEILQYDFWGFTQLQIRTIATIAMKSKLGWLDTMLKLSEWKESGTIDLSSKYSEAEKLNLAQKIIIEALANIEIDFCNELREIGLFFLDLAKKSLNEPGELIIDRLIGVDSVQSSEDTQGEEGNENVEVVSGYQSRYKRVYFDKLLAKVDSQKDLKLLSNLRFLINSIRSFGVGKILTLSEIVATLQIYQSQQDLNLVDNSVFMTTTMSVNLMTAHKSKGLEFDTVFVINCNQSNWVSGNKGQKVSLLSNLNLAGESDNNDDKMRLFYVALTRAENHLYLTSSCAADNGEVVNELSFLQYLHQDDLTKSETRDLKNEVLEIDLQKKHPETKLEKQEYKILEAVLKDYKMPVTHLNNFLDMELKPGSTKRGPAKFLEANLLRFPQTPNSKAAYGTAMHKAMQDFYNQSLKFKSKPSIEFLTENFELSLNQQKLISSEREKLRVYGVQNLTKWFELKQSMETDFRVEHSFATGVKIGEAMLTGNLDKMILDIQERTITVVDYKTGKIIQEWDRYVKDPKKPPLEVGDLKISKEQSYNNQLLFYKLLVENSPEFKNKYQVKTGQLEFIDCSKQATSYDYITIPTLELDLDHVETQRLHKIIQAVWKRIMNLDFSLPKEFDESIAGTKEWMDYLAAEGE
jgi:DNA helicase II / ATP-dependent DNA helicase PcrA